MSRSDVNHDSYLPGRNGPGHSRRQSSQSSNECFYDAPLVHSINSSMIASDSSHPLSPALLRSSTYPSSDCPDTNGRASPDPHEYYRPHQPDDVGKQNPGENGNSMAHPPQFNRIASLPSYNTESSPRTNLPQHRSTSDSSYRGVGAASTKTTSDQPPTARSRQVSFKDLIHKFDKKNDQVLPSPARSQGRSTTVTPAGSPTTAKPPSVTRWNAANPSGPDSPVDVVAPAAGMDGSTRTPANLRTQAISPPRRALQFGGRLSVDTGARNPSPGHRRGGSDGSIPSPNPAAALDPSPGRSPLTPTAWYLGKTPFLEAVDPNATASNNHRRAISDFHQNTLSPGFGPKQPISRKAATPPLQQEEPIPSSTAPAESPHSKSRIPISCGRLNSDASPASSTTLRNHASTQVPLPPKGISRLPKPASPPQSPPGMADDDRPEPFSTGPARRETAHGRVRPNRSGRNSNLQAYIATPPQRKPASPLHLSRPRQPVSTLTTPTGPPSKVVEKVSHLQRQITRGRETRGSRRERRLPEVGHVDFATRRHRIQQAFNRTVQENERKEEEAAELQRQVQIGEEKQPLLKQSQQQNTVNEVPPLPRAEGAATVIDEADDQHHPIQPSIPEPDLSHNPPQLHLDTDIPSPGTRTAAQPATMDSPTLGLPAKDALLPHSEPKSSCMPPLSAVTLDSNVTAFDPEPQSGLVPGLDMSHRTLLSQIMQFRESSPSSSSCDEPDYNFSDNDDKESIPIILRDRSCLDESVDGSENQETPNICQLPQDQAHTGDEPPPSNRWSMSSWSSSGRDQQFADARFDDGSGEDLAQLAPLADDSEAATQSCSASSSTPPSALGHQFTVTPPHIGASPEAKRESTSTRSTVGISTAPSLARLGGWDSKRVTQLYFEELARGRGSALSVPDVRASPEPRRTDTDQGTDGRPDSLTDDPVLVPSFEDVPASDQARHSASLVFRDDWEHASPSIADWMQIAAADESAAPSDDKRAGPIGDGAPTPRLDTSQQALSGADESEGGLGLAINVQGPQVESPEVPAPSAPEAPTKPPPSPPQTFSDVSSAAQEQKQPKNPAQTAAFAPLGLAQSTDSSESSSLRRLELIPSPQAQLVDSSATSLAPSHSDPASTDIRKPSPSPEQRMLKKRRHVIKELVDTEYNFGRDMKVVDDIYKGTSSSCLDLEDGKILFGNSDQVVQFSMAFQDSLKNAAKSIYVMPKSERWSSKRARNRQLHATNDDQASGAGAEASELDKDRATFVGQTFVTHVAQMEKVYSDYLRNHDAANKKLQVLQRNPKVAIWLKECRDWASDLTTAWDLDSLLVKPVQRILKYPLLLSELVDSTPKDHPDHTALFNALEEVTNISVRINEMKKRADLVGQVVGRKRNQSDVRAGLSKAFGRRTEKLRQHVGLSDLFEDKEYDSLTQRFGDSYFQLQVVMRDVEMYTQEAQGSMDRFHEFILAIEGFIDVAQSNYSELETKWRQLKITVQDIIMVTLPDHLAIVRKSVIEPMITLLKLHDGPQTVMRKRDKRLMDYARFKATKDRGDKPDKKTTEQGEQFVALNETLKDELPKLYALTAKLMEACLKNFVQIQTTWFNTLQNRLAPLVESFPDDVEKIFNEWASDFTFSDAQVLSLGICNGSMLADTLSQVSFNTPSIGATASSPGRPSTVNSANTRVGSMEESPKASHEFSTSTSSHQLRSPSMESQSQIPTERLRADSSVSGPGARSVLGESLEISHSQKLQRITSTSSGSVPAPTNTSLEAFPSLPQLSLDTPFLTDHILNTSSSENPPTTPGTRYSGFFSSAMPMSDNPEENITPAEPAESEPAKEPKVIFLAASIYEFNIDRARREAGYPYLTYVAGEIFDVIAEKGELWLAKNQDDPTRQVGWIWNKHFAKLSG